MNLEVTLLSPLLGLERGAPQALVTPAGDEVTCCRLLQCAEKAHKLC